MTPSSEGPWRVAIVGAGTVGSVVALAAAREGCRVRLFDRPGRAARGRRLFTLNAPAVSELRRAGAWDLLRTATAARAMRVVSPGGRVLAIDARDAGLAQICHTVYEDDLGKALDARLKDEGIEIESVSEVRSVSTVGDSAVLDMDGRRIEAHLAVGADGASSQVARLLGIDAPRTDFGQVALTGEAAFSRMGQVAWQWMRTDGILALLPAPGGRCGIVWSVPASRAERLSELPEAKLRAKLERASSGMVGECVEAGRLRGHPLGCRIRRPCKGRAVLMGDSAHIMHALAGQNLCAALGGVAELFESADGCDPGSADALARYARLRRVRLRVTAGITSMMSGVVGGPHSGRAMDICFSAPRFLTAAVLPVLANAR